MAIKEKYKPFVLPSDFKELESYVKLYKTDLTERVISSIEFAIKKNLPMVEVFNFKNSDFVITISREAFLDNIQNVYNFYIQEEKYELCKRVKQIELLLDSTNKPKKLNEKKQE